MLHRSIEELKEIDRAHKPGGVRYEEESIKLSELYHDQSRGLTLRHLRTLGQGDPDLATPITTGGNILTRIIEELATLYANPISRFLVDSTGSELEDDHPDQIQAMRVLEDLQYDLAWQSVDELRTVHRNVLMAFVEGPRAVAVRVFEPHNFFRDPDANLAADSLEADRAIAMQVQGSSDSGDDGNRYQLWEQYGSVLEPDWRMWVVNESGTEVGDQPYGETGETGFKVGPFLLVHDEYPRGRAYLPQRESMVSSALSVNTSLNDLAFTQKNQAHTQIISEGDDQRGIGETGPGRVWQVPSDHRVYPLKLDPALAESSAMLDHQLRLWCSSEGLPSDRFLSARNIATGPQARVLETPIARRRQKQLRLAHRLERDAYRIIRAVHNRMAGLWQVAELSPDYDLRITITRQDPAQDSREHQEMAYKDMAIGALDLVDYVMHRRGCTRTEARQYLLRARASLDEFPLRQNPASMTEGPAPAGVNGEKVRGEFHPEVAASVDANSTTGAVVSALEVPGGSA